MAQQGMQPPFLEIVEEPQSKGFRFRYGCEGKSHGGVQGSMSGKGRKTYPTVKVRNYFGSVKIVASLVTNEDNPRPHAHELIGRNCDKGVCSVYANGEEPVISFQNIGIKHITKKNVSSVLRNKLRESYIFDKHLHFRNTDIYKVTLSEEEEASIWHQSEDLARDMQLSVVRIQFLAYLLDSGGTTIGVLPPVYSCPIYDSKAPCASLLKICRMDKAGGCCSGNEEVFLLCDKVQKEDIAVRFYELDEQGNIGWERYGQFGPLDVHRQYAIVFRTPAYHTTNISSPVPVHIQLVRISDNEVSDPKTFVYYPVKTVPDVNSISLKRKKRFEIGGFEMSTCIDDHNQLNSFPIMLDEHSQTNIGKQEDQNRLVSSIQGFENFITSSSSPPPSSSSSSFNPLIGRGVDPKNHDKQQKGGLRLVDKIDQLSECLRLYSCTEDTRFLVSPLKALIRSQNDDGDNSLHLSVIHNKTMATFNLLSVLNSSPRKHVAVNAVNKLQQSPVSIAIVTKESVQLKMLLESGCSVSWLSKEGGNLLHEAAKLDHHQSIELLFKFRQDHFKRVIDQFNYKGYTAVHEASKRGNLSCLKSLVNHGADVQLKDQLSGRTALHHAILGDHICVLAYLILETTIDLNSPTFNGVTPLQMALTSDRPQMVELLTSIGAQFTEITISEKSSESGEEEEDDDEEEDDGEEEEEDEDENEEEEEEEEDKVAGTDLELCLSKCAITDDQTPAIVDTITVTTDKEIPCLKFGCSIFDSGIESFLKEDEVQESLDK